MRKVSADWTGREEEVTERMKRESVRMRAMLHRHRPVRGDDRVLEVGSGAMGHIFHFGVARGIGVDPLADHYVSLFPAWQRLAATIAAPGEQLPFRDGEFDVVISDNVIDHAEDPGRIVAEIARVLKPGGVFFLAVHVHHPVYHVASTAYGALRAVGLPLEVTPFADHTVHLTTWAARRLFSALPFRILSESADFEEAKRHAAGVPPRHLGDRLKRVFTKNARMEVMAIRT